MSHFPPSEGLPASLLALVSRFDRRHLGQSACVVISTLRCSIYYNCESRERNAHGQSVPAFSARKAISQVPTTETCTRRLGECRTFLAFVLYHNGGPLLLSGRLLNGSLRGGHLRKDDLLLAQGASGGPWTTFRQSAQGAPPFWPGWHGLSPGKMGKGPGAPNPPRSTYCRSKHPCDNPHKLPPGGPQTDGF